ncbi:unnamed protein product [[Actinomadura] parvosata subsp. kistnae]|uniref:DUF6879 domain-containing protein n=1 Tax=[Actinomadura] parvosata subsp. kistnae TaxID=1909395 RepID=A0A1V0A847_9ACTN|nr:DUF6879 family protein [Nonomuraea sp. ATCC 55076]AQZ66374.1 hypothetical protein BKM31_37365 [Nonomuraea sp. ATCC 55076]SPL95595.1 unnamed protein product [Actinomadura parvosata subsp. kistnae]
MLERIHEIPAAVLSADEYLDDFWPNFHQLDGVFWKLERLQSFRGEPSWAAMVEGDWDRSLKLVDDGRGAPRERPAKRYPRRRIRIVEQPVTSYVRWEAHLLALRGEAAEQVRVLDAGEVAEIEVGRRLPELVVLGTVAMYEVTYDESGAHSGARRIDDREVIEACQGELDKLFQRGEELRPYYEREIMPLPAPTVPV